MVRNFSSSSLTIFFFLKLSLWGVVNEDELLLRWSFDEGTGSVSQDLMGSGLGVILHPGSGWGAESNGTAKSGSSLDLSSGSGRGTVLHDPRLQASNDFTCMFWFKSSGIPNDFSQLISKRSDSISSYFVQIDQGGASLQTVMRKYGTYYDTGSINFNPNQWYLLAFTHDGEKITTFLDGIAIRELQQTDPVFVEEGPLGIGGTADGGSLFRGWIDDLRFYGKALS